MFRVSGRARKILVGVFVAMVVLGGLFLAVLPEIVRRVAIAQVPKLTHRILLLDDVDLNLFTGHLALKGVKVQAPGTNERAYEIERIDVRLDYLPFFVRHVRVTEITVVAPKVQVLRRGPTEFDFSDLLDLFKGGEPSKEPSKWTVTLERLTVQRLTGVGRDQTTSPESVWRIDDLNLAANGLMIGPGAQPGRLQLSFKLNDAPIAVNDEFTINPANPPTVPNNVMTNDSDIDGDALTASLVSGPAHGTLSLNSDGTFSYAPQDGYSGDDAFRYQLFDGKANSNVATATLHVTPGTSQAPPPPTQAPPPAENQRPIAANDVFSVAQDTALDVPAASGLLTNDSDPEGSPLTVSWFSGPLHGTASVGNDGSLHYTPTSGYTGMDAMLYRVSDGQLFSPLAAVTIHVTPTASPDPAP